MIGRGGIKDAGDERAVVRKGKGGRAKGFWCGRRPTSKCTYRTLAESKVA